MRTTLPPALPGIATAVGLPFIYFYYMAPDRYVALAISMIPSLVGGMYLGPTFAVTQALVPPRLRAQASAVLLFVLNIIGLGLGPQFVGLLSDWLEPRYQIESIRYALLWTVAGGALWSTLHYALGARTLQRDLQSKRDLE